MTPVVRGDIDLNTSSGSTWTNIELVHRLMEREGIDADAIQDTSFDLENPGTAFEAFRRFEICKPVFPFGDGA